MEIMGELVEKCEEVEWPVNYSPAPNATLTIKVKEDTIWNGLSVPHGAVHRSVRGPESVPLALFGPQRAPF
jgi:hypothetical protein